MQKKIAANDPAMKLSFTEWNYGGGSDISGAIATADTLGIFGSYGVYMGVLFPVWHDESFTYAALRRLPQLRRQRRCLRRHRGHSHDDRRRRLVGLREPAVRRRLAPGDRRHQQGDDDEGRRHRDQPLDGLHEGSVYVLTQAGGAKMVAGAGLTSVATNAFRYPMPAQSVTVIVPSP